MSEPWPRQYRWLIGVRLRLDLLLTSPPRWYRFGKFQPDQVLHRRIRRGQGAPVSAKGNADIPSPVAKISSVTWFGRAGRAPLSPSTLKFRRSHPEPLTAPHSLPRLTLSYSAPLAHPCLPRSQSS